MRGRCSPPFEERDSTYDFINILSGAFEIVERSGDEEHVVAVDRPREFIGEDRDALGPGRLPARGLLQKVASARSRSAAAGTPGHPPAAVVRLAGQGLTENLLAMAWIVN